MYGERAYLKMVNVLLTKIIFEAISEVDPI